MSIAKHADSDRPQGARWTTERGRNPAAAAKVARQVSCKLCKATLLLHGADLESTSRRYGVTAATLSEWRKGLPAAVKALWQVAMNRIVPRKSMHRIGDLRPQLFDRMGHLRDLMVVR